MSSPDALPVDRPRLRRAVELLIDMAALHAAAREWLREEVAEMMPALRADRSAAGADAIVDRLLATVDSRVSFEDAATVLICEMTVRDPR